MNLSEGRNSAHSFKPGGRSHLLSKGLLDFPNWKWPLPPLKLQRTRPFLLWLTGWRFLPSHRAISCIWPRDRKELAKALQPDCPKFKLHISFLLAVQTWRRSLTLFHCMNSPQFHCMNNQNNNDVHSCGGSWQCGRNEQRVAILEFSLEKISAHPYIPLSSLILFPYFLSLRPREGLHFSPYEVRCGNMVTSAQWNMDRSGTCYFQTESLRSWCTVHVFFPCCSEP